MKKRIMIPIVMMLLSSCSLLPSSSSNTTSNDESTSHITTSETTSNPTSEQVTSNTTSEKAQELENINYVKLYSPSDYNYVYAWEGNNYPYGSWPGKRMSKYNDDWVTSDMTALTEFNVIFHDNKGNQSSDLRISQGTGHYFYVDGILSKRTSIPSASSGGEDIEFSYPNNEKAYRNYYQLLVYSFADSDGDGVGDFKGIKDKLTYLKQLGIESIWLSPINKCSSYHAYDVLDYYSVNPKYEVNGYTLSSLIRDAHNEGIQIVLDMVLNHTSNSHKWVREHSSWYSSDNKFGMPEFNFDNKEVREEMKNIGRYWLNDVGVDGFRLDAAMWVYNNGTNRHKKNYAWWQEWCQAMREEKEDVYIVAEVLDSDHDQAYEYAQGGFNSTFDFEAMKHVYSAVKNASYDYAGNTLLDLAKAQKYNPNYCLARILSNHDVGRFSDVHNDMGDAKAYYLTTFDELRLANSLNILTPGNTYIYYGDELGLKGTCPQGWDDMKARTPMPFSSERTDSVKYFEGFKGNGVTTSTTLSGKSAEEDQASSTSLYATMSTLLNLKINHPTLKKGTMSKLSSTLPSGLNGYNISGAENITVIYNSSSSAVSYSFTGNLLYSSNNSSGNSINIPSKGLIVYNA